MMPYLVAAVVLIGAVALLNLVLSMGIIRRLREQAASLPEAQVPHLPAPGEQVGDFTVRTTGGDTVSRDGLRGDTAVAFFSPNCQPCQETVPQFAEYARALPGGPDWAVAVVVGNGAEAAEMVAKLTPVARVVTETDAEVLQSAFRPNGFPSIYLIGHDGVVVASGHGMAALPAPAAA
jgi:thiol-disulfide isomerase/thioredoxin